MDDQQITMDTLAKVYIKMRDRIQEMTKELDALKEKQNSLKLAMKDRLLSEGSKSMRTDHGTVTMTKKTRYFTTDWSAFDAFVLEHKVPSLYERRISQKEMAEFMEANPGVVPMGLNSETDFTISVRKS